MKRQIKFRAWYDETMHYESMQRYLGGYGLFFGIEKPIDVMQYTGLHDKNGKEIYEGDIVYLAGYGLYEVEFPFIELYEASMENDIGDIIGNIYENPELL